MARAINTPPFTTPSGPGPAVSLSLSTTKGVDSKPDVQIKPAINLADGTLTPEIAEAMGIPFKNDLTQEQASGRFVERIPISFARQHVLLGIDSTHGRLPVAIGSLKAWGQLDVLSRFLGVPVRPVAAPAAQIHQAINRAYQDKKGLVLGLMGDEVNTETLSNRQHEDLLDVDSRAPVIQLVNQLLLEAIKKRASDVHLQPLEEGLVVRVRIDGALFDAHTLPLSRQDEIVSRIKVMGRMNIAEKRVAQDGRTTVELGDNQIDLRISSIPTCYGEQVVIRLLDKNNQLFTLDQLGMGPDMLAPFGRLIRAEHGLILVTGPTGSGKSTTLYASLQEIYNRERNILTLEDPIEYRVPGISQTQVNNKKGMTFADGLRSVLRQDPDVIMVGEIRDKETAVMAIQSALTGHLVFSTLHTNDAASAVTRLLDLGIEPYLVSSSLLGVLAQRLVRKVCQHCGARLPPDRFRIEEPWHYPGHDRHYKNETRQRL